MVPNMITKLHINSVVKQRKTEETGFDSREGNLIFLFSNEPKRALGPSQPPT